LAEKPSAVERLVARVVAVIEPAIGRVLGIPRIGMAHQVYSRYAAASGPVLARGLAFGALFALVPGLLVVLSIAGYFVRDPALREEIVAIVADQIPPLAPLIDEVLKNAGDLAATSGIIGLVLLIWSASGLVRALDGAFRVVFEDDGEGRTPIRDVITVIAVAGGVFGAALLLVLLVLPSPLSEVIGAPGLISSGGLSVVGIAALIGLAYRFVPRPRPPWRILGLPTFLVSLAIWLLTTLFAVLGPLLFGSADLYGAFGSLFLGLIWLGYVTQLLLLGAAWVAERDRRAREARGALDEAAGI
jgi:membrane protein